MKYFVTHCTFDKRFTGNPFWHSSLVLSRWDDTQPGCKIEVVRHEGFYGTPSTTRSSWLSRIKIAIGLDVDLSGNHGWWKTEEMRFMEMGNDGLHGTTFEITEKQFNDLNARCSEMKRKQKAAVQEFAELVKNQHPELKNSTHLKKPRIYADERYGPFFLTLENQQAQQSNYSPRLKPFDLKIRPSLWGLDLTQSHTCKSRAMEVLQGILPQKHIDRLTENGKHPTVPRLSGKQEHIYFHSEGTLHKHTRSSGQAVHFRNHKDEGTKLYWTLPPQELIPLPGSRIKEQLGISPDYCKEVKQVISQLQQIEWLFINAVLPENYEPYRQQLITIIRDHFSDFATIENTNNLQVEGFKGYLFYLFNQPRNHKEMELLDKIAAAKELLNTLYAAVVDDWEIHDNSIASNNPVVDTELHDTNLAANKENEEDNDSEALAAYLTIADKKALCKILRRPYLQPSLKEFLDAHSPNR